MNLIECAESTVFVVDDDFAACQSLASIVSADGINVEMFSSSEEFLASRKHLTPGCLVTDIQISGMSGLGLLRASLSLNCRMPSILISEVADIKAAVEAMTLGAITVLQKPYHELELRENVRRALSLDSVRRESSLWNREYACKLESLTAGERRVMDLLVRGEPHKAISAELDIAIRTVELRRQNVLKKMGFTTIVELAAAATRFEARGFR